MNAAACRHHHVHPRPSLGGPISATATWRTWGTGVAVVVEPAEVLVDASRLLRQELEAMDAACNRFRKDSELAMVNRAEGRPVRVGPLCMEALEVARRAAEQTEGAVDPTIGAALCALGYDRDFDEVIAGGDPGDDRSSGSRGADDAQAGVGGLRGLRGLAAPGWRSLVLDPEDGTVAVPAGTALDLGATAKALCADRAARRIAGELECRVIVDLGGDLAVGGPPPSNGWQVALVEDARRHVVPEDADGAPDGDSAAPAVSLWRGGLASSGTSVRTWNRGGVRLHHIVDPATGWPAEPVWQMATIAADSCVTANTFSTAAIVWGEDAPFRVGQLGLAARFVRALDGGVLEVGNWPRSVPAA